MPDTATTTLSSKGQVVIPKAVRDLRRWSAGITLEVRSTPDGVLLTPVAAPQKVPLREGLAAIRRRVAHQGPPVSLENMDAAVLREARKSAAKR